jgi:hypothetical protein
LFCSGVLVAVWVSVCVWTTVVCVRSVSVSVSVRTVEVRVEFVVPGVVALVVLDVAAGVDWVTDLLSDLASLADAAAVCERLLAALLREVDAPHPAARSAQAKHPTSIFRAGRHAEGHLLLLVSESINSLRPGR